MIFLIVGVVGHHLAWFYITWTTGTMSDQEETRPNIGYKITLILLPIFALTFNTTLIYCFIFYSAVERIFAKTGNSLNVVKDDGFTTLHIAAINDHREIAKILLTKVIL